VRRRVVAPEHEREVREHDAGDGGHGRGAGEEHVPGPELPAGGGRRREDEAVVDAAPAPRHHVAAVQEQVQEQQREHAQHRVRRLHVARRDAAAAAWSRGVEVQPRHVRHDAVAQEERREAAGREPREEGDGVRLLALRRLEVLHGLAAVVAGEVPDEDVLHLVHQLQRLQRECRLVSSIQSSSLSL